MHYRKTPAGLTVGGVGRSLAFWVDRTGFQKTGEVPDGDVLAFVIVEKDGAELMVQSLASVQRDEPKFAKTGPASLFIEVPDLEDIKKRLAGHPIAMAEKTTFYGMKEIGVFEPGGHVAVFAQKIG